MGGKWTRGPTHWSQLLEERREEAWGYFYRTYAPAVQSLFRHKGVRTECLEDLVHEFFTVALERELLAKADPERGRFRSYLRTVASRFLATHWRDRARQLRKPEGELLQLDEGLAGDPHTLTPEEAFDLAWARSVLERGTERAREVLLAKGREGQFQAFLIRQDDTPWKEVAAELGTSADTARKWAERAERLVARYVREEISSNVSLGGDLDVELRELATILARPG